MPLELRNSEKVILIRRRHWFVLFTEMVIVFFMVLVSFVVAFFLDPYFGDYLITLLFVITMLMVSLIMTFHFIADYYLDIWIVTDQRSLRVELKGLFNRTVKSISHNRIQDVRVEVKGVFATFLDFGDLRIQTAGAYAGFVFEQIPNPHEIKEAIYKASSNHKDLVQQSPGPES